MGIKFLATTSTTALSKNYARIERRLGFAIEIDGGVGPENIAEVARAGVDWAVVGTHVFRAADPAQAIRDMLKTADEALSVKV